MAVYERVADRSVSSGSSVIGVAILFMRDCNFSGMLLDFLRCICVWTESVGLTWVQFYE